MAFSFPTSYEENAAVFNKVGNPGIQDDYDTDTGQADSNTADGRLLDPTANNHPVVATHRSRANLNNEPSGNAIPAAYCPKPPDPSLGGQPGRYRQLGFTKGMRTSRAFRRRFNDESLHIVTQNQVHPVEGPVGFSNRSDRLIYGANVVMNGTGAPTNLDVTEMYADPNFAAAVATTWGVNPAYV